MERESFIFYRSFYTAIAELPKDIRLEVLTAIIEYALDGKLPENLKPFAKGMFTLIKPNIDSNTARYINGTKGGRKSKKKTSAVDPEYSLSYEEEIELMRSDKEWKQSILEEFLIDSDMFETLLPRFLKQCVKDSKKKGKTGHDSAEDARNHFRYWLPKTMGHAVQSSPEILESQKSQPPLDTNTGKTDLERRRELERKEREEQWEKRQREAVSPDTLIRKMGYDPERVSLAQAMNPEWREKNPPESFQSPK